MLSDPARHPRRDAARRVIDFVVRVLTLAGVAMPIFWLALVMLDIFYLHLGWAPAPGGSIMRCNHRRR